MQKKILASILMVPMAYSAFANIAVEVPVNKTAWNSTGILADELQFNDVTGSINSAVAPVGTGELTTTASVPAPGHYALTFTEINNLTVSIKVDGKDVELVEFKGRPGFIFDVTGGGQALTTLLSPSLLRIRQPPSISKASSLR